MDNNGVWLIEIDAVDGSNNPAKLRFSSGEYLDTEGYFWNPRLKQPALYKAGLYVDQFIRAERSGYGEVVLINIDGELNDLVNYAFDGRNLVCKFFKDGVVSEVLNGTVSRVEFSNSEVSLILRDPVAVFSNNHPRNYFLGDNILPDGLEGTEFDIKGLPKPRVYGYVSNGSPVLVNTSKLIYQISDIDLTILSVYDRGVPLTKGSDYTSLSQMQSTEPLAGQFRCFQGYFRLGSMPSGEVTCDAERHSDDQKLGNILSDIFNEVGFTLDNTSKDDLNSFGEFGYYLKTEEVTTETLVNTLVSSLCGYWRVSSSGQIFAGKLFDPSETPVLEIYDYQITSFERESTGSGSNGVPIKEVNIFADKIETVQTDIAGLVASGEDGITVVYGGNPYSTFPIITNTNRKSRLENEYRSYTARRSSVEARHILSESVEVYSRVKSMSDAEIIAEYVLDIISVRRDTVNINVRLSDIGVGLDIGQTIKLYTDRADYTSGRNLVIIGYTFDIERDAYELNLWG